uniref:Uncharacterized protein n=1 Tax=Anguilla anguilla TaxID=7936 RepID=A0A0E9UN25_ANGAN
MLSYPLFQSDAISMSLRIHPGANLALFRIDDAMTFFCFVSPPVFLELRLKEGALQKLRCPLVEGSGMYTETGERSR